MKEKIRMQNKHKVSEFIKHLKHMVIPRAFYAVVLLLLNCLCIIAFGEMLKTPFSNIGALSNEYDHILLSNDYYSEYSCEWHVDSLITISNSKGVRINSNVYIDVPDESNDSCNVNTDLSENEIVISQNIADKLRVSVGDEVYLSFSVFENDVNYIVKEISPYIWNYYDVESNRDFSIAYIGNNEVVLNQISGEYIYFLNEQDYEAFMVNNNSYNQRYLIQNEIDYLTKRIIILEIIEVILFLVVNSCFFIFSMIWIEKETGKYYRNSFPVSFVKKMRWLDYFLYSLFPEIIAILMLWCLADIKLIYPVEVVLSVFCLAEIFVVILKGKKRYGKAY